jgi:CheY-like chemotaxis protein
VLLAEDDRAMRALLASVLKRDGFEVLEARDGQELLEELGRALLRPVTERAMDLVISDVRMPRRSGLEVLLRLREADWATPVILITAFGGPATLEEARRLGAQAVFRKPFDLNALRVTAAQLALPR